MRASNVLIAALKGFEDCKLESYKDSCGVWTIGYGHTYGVKEGQKITSKQAESMLRVDLLPCEKDVTWLGVWTQGQFDALVDFAFNQGIEALIRSPLLSKIKLNSSQDDITEGFLRWNKIRTKILNPSTKKWEIKVEELKGLTVRREWEAQRFFEV